MSDLVARTALERMHHQPVMVSDNQAMTLASNMAKMAQIQTSEQAAEQEDKVISHVCAAYGFGNRDAGKPFIFQNGVAVIPVHGTLINRFGGSWGFVTGYNYINRMRNLAEADDDVELIVYDHHSGGGEVGGAFETAAGIFGGRGKKPTMAVVDHGSYSAAYMQAVAADKIYVTPTGGVGSVGVYSMHVDMSEMLKNWGLNITLVHSGDHKVDGNPFSALSDEVKADIQARVDKTRTNFVNLVAEYRGLEPEAVRKTEGRCYDADTALDMGLIDGIATPAEAIQSFFNPSDDDNGATEMTQESAKTTTGAAAGADNAEQNQTNADALRNEGASAERTRIAGIQNCEEAKGREALATHLALNTSMSVEDAKGILAATPAAKAPSESENAETNHLESAMKRSGGGADVGADVTGDDQQDDKNASANSLLSDYAMATGKELD